MSKYNNPRYAAYARAHGKSPDEMMEHDEKAWPGGVMCGFTLWISQQSRLFYKEHPECFLDKGFVIHDQDAFSDFLGAAA
jgi:hypothetical protein